MCLTLILPKSRKTWELIFHIFTPSNPLKHSQPALDVHAPTWEFFPKIPDKIQRFFYQISILYLSLQESVWDSRAGIFHVPCRVSSAGKRERGIILRGWCISQRGCFITKWWVKGITRKRQTSPCLSWCCQKPPWKQGGSIHSFSFYESHKIQD